MTVSTDEHLTVLQLLEAGHSCAEVSRRTGWSQWSVRKVRDEHCIPSLLPGRHPLPTPVVEDGDESQGSGSATPWIPPKGYDMYMPRPDQAGWKAMCAAATPDERFRLQVVMCTVLGVPSTVSADSLAAALMAEHRTAEELAGLYLLARGRRAV